MRFVLAVLAIVLICVSAVAVTDVNDFASGGKLNLITDSYYSSVKVLVVPQADSCPADNSTFTQYYSQPNSFEMDFPASIKAGDTYAVCFDNDGTISRLDNGGSGFTRNDPNTTLTFDAFTKSLVLTFSASIDAGHEIYFDVGKTVIIIKDGIFVSDSTLIDYTTTGSETSPFKLTIPTFFSDSDFYNSELTVNGIKHSVTDLAISASYTDVQECEPSSVYTTILGSDAFILPSGGAMVNIPAPEVPRFVFEQLDPNGGNTITYTCTYEDEADQCLMSIWGGNSISTNSGAACSGNTCTVAITESAPIPRLAFTLINSDGTTTSKSQVMEPDFEVTANGSSKSVMSPNFVVLTTFPIMYETSISGTFAPDMRAYVSFASHMIESGMYYDISDIKMVDSDGKSIDCVKFDKNSIRLERKDAFEDVDFVLWFENKCSGESVDHTAVKLSGNVKTNNTLPVELFESFQGSTITFARNGTEGQFPGAKLEFDTTNLAEVEITFTTTYDMIGSGNGFYVSIGDDYDSCMRADSRYMSASTGKLSNVPFTFAGKYTVCVKEGDDNYSRFYAEEVDITGTDVKLVSIEYDSDNQLIKAKFDPVTSNVELYMNCDIESDLYGSSLDADNNVHYQAGIGIDYKVCMGLTKNTLVEIPNFKVTYWDFDAPTAIPSFDMRSDADYDVLIDYSDVSYSGLKLFTTMISESACPAKKSSDFKTPTFNSDGISNVIVAKASKTYNVCYCFGSTECGTAGTFTVPALPAVTSASIGELALMEVKFNSLVLAGATVYGYLTPKAAACDNESPLWTPMYGSGTDFTLDVSKFSGDSYLCTRIGGSDAITYKGADASDFSVPAIVGAFAKDGSGHLVFTWNIPAAYIPSGTTDLRIAFPATTIVDDGAGVDVIASATVTETIATGTKAFAYTKMLIPSTVYLSFVNADNNDITHWFTTTGTIVEQINNIPGYTIDVTNVPAPAANAGYKKSVGGKAIVPAVGTSIDKVAVPTVAADLIALMDDANPSFTIKRKCVVPSVFTCELTEATSSVSTLAITSTTCVGDTCTYVIATGNTDALPELEMTVKSGTTVIAPELLPSFSVETSATNGNLTDITINSQAVELYGKTYTITMSADASGVKAGGNIPFTVSLDRPLDDGETLVLSSLKTEGASVSFKDSKLTFAKGALSQSSTFKYSGESNKTITGFTATVETAATRYDSTLFSAAFAASPIQVLGKKDEGMSTLMWVAIIGGGLLIIGAIVAVLMLFVCKGKKNKGAAPTNKASVEMAEK